MSEKKVSLFDLHRAIEVHTITDGDLSVTIGFRSPSHAQSVNALELLAEKRDEIEKSARAEVIRKQLAQRAADMTSEILITLVLMIEEPTVSANLDLAPAPGESSAPESETEEAKAAREAAALERWKTERRDALASMEIGALRELYLEQQQRLVIQSQALAHVQLTELVLMVVDPETRRPVFSMDEKAENYIGNVAPEVISDLNEKKSEYLMKRSDQRIREQAKSGPFGRSGASRRRRPSSPGATREIQSISLPSPPDSSADASG